MPESPNHLPADFSGEVRLFPLPDLVMFPGNALPLHIFESRYREMLEDAIQDDHLLTMATLQPGYDSDYYSRPAVAPEVCIGRISAYQKNEQGTYNLILVGIERARIEREIEPVRSFRRAVVNLLQLTPEGSEQPAAHMVGRQLLDRVCHTTHGAEKLVEAFEQGRLSLGALTDILAFHLPLDMRLKLQLLGEADSLARARCLVENMPTVVEARRKITRPPPKFSDN